MPESSAPHWAIAVLIPSISGLVGVVLGSSLNLWRERQSRRYQFMVRQLQELYSPLLGLRAEILVRSTLRARIQSEADVAWRQLVAEAREVGTEAMQRVTDTRFPEFKATIDYDNLVFTEHLLPTYRKMLESMRDNLWLAESGTREHFRTLVEFVDIWNRWIEKSLPVEVFNRLDHREEKLFPLYDHLVDVHDRLRSAISQGRHKLP